MELDTHQHHQVHSSTLRHRQTEASRRAKLKAGFEELRRLTDAMPQVQRSDVLFLAVNMIKRQQAQLHALKEIQRDTVSTSLLTPPTPYSPPQSFDSFATEATVVDLHKPAEENGEMQVVDVFHDILPSSMAAAIYTFSTVLDDFNQAINTPSPPLNETRLLSDNLLRFLISPDLTFLQVNEAFQTFAHPTRCDLLLGLNPVTSGCKVDHEVVGVGIMELLQGLRTLLITQERIRPLVVGAPAVWMRVTVFPLDDSPVFMGCMEPLAQQTGQTPAILV
eukprot:m.8897 g.8897  ORF g.8897 m.8897 type:complete len:278 (-) comp9312_c0_seq1:9-842(-)